MKKIIYIDGKPVPLKTHAAIPFQYRHEFGTDFFKDIFNLSKSLGNNEEVSLDELENVNIEIFYRLLWLFAHAANPEIGDMMTWLSTLENFSIVEVFQEVQPLLMSLMQRKKPSTHPKPKRRKKKKSSTLKVI